MIARCFNSFRGSVDIAVTITDCLAAQEGRANVPRTAQLVGRDVEERGRVMVAAGCSVGIARSVLKVQSRAYLRVGHRYRRIQS